MSEADVIPINYDLRTDRALDAAVESGVIDRAEHFLRLAQACLDQANVPGAKQIQVAALLGLDFPEWCK